MVASRHTYRDWVKAAAKNLLRNTTAKINQLMLNLLMVNTTRETREEGEISRSVHVRSVDQKLLSDIDWEKNPGNKKDLIKRLWTKFRTGNARNLFQTPFFINSGKNAWAIRQQ